MRCPYQLSPSEYSLEDNIGEMSNGGMITWLKKGYSLWKPKAKAKPKNKCQR